MTFDALKPLVIELVSDKIATRDEKLKQIEKKKFEWFISSRHCTSENTYDGGS